MAVAKLAEQSLLTREFRAICLLIYENKEYIALFVFLFLPFQSDDC